jgi:hypothetical protein
MPFLEKTPNSRVIVVSSGGMYNTKFPSFEDATSTGLKPYDGQMAYVSNNFISPFYFSSQTFKHHIFVIF